MLQTWYRTIHGNLYIFWQRTGHAAHIHFVGITALWLYKYLMSVLICKSYYLIFNRRTISWSGSLNHSRIQRRTIQIRPDNLMRLLIGVSQPAGYLINLYILRICRKGKWHHSFITKLLFHFRKVNGTFVNTGRCSCLKTEHLNSICLQGICQMISRLKPVWSSIITDITIDTSCLQIRSCT